MIVHSLTWARTSSRAQGCRQPAPPGARTSEPAAPGPQGRAKGSCSGHGGSRPGSGVTARRQTQVFGRSPRKASPIPSPVPRGRGAAETAGRVVRGQSDRPQPRPRRPPRRSHRARARAPPPAPRGVRGRRRGCARTRSRLQATGITGAGPGRLRGGR